MTQPEPTAEAPAEQPIAPPAAEPVAEATAAQRRSWSMPKSPLTREQADEMGRAAAKAIAAIARFVAGIARSGGHTIRRIWRVIEAVPATVQLFCGAGVGMLLGLVGAITLRDNLGVICTVVVIPVCAGIVGALGHRWYSGLGTAGTPRQAETAEPRPSDLQRSVRYVDAKLGQALSSFGTEHHQQAVIALFQAKTAVELTLGTEQDPASYLDVPLRAEDYGLRPRIKAGPSSSLRESNSLAAS